MAFAEKSRPLRKLAGAILLLCLIGNVMTGGLAPPPACTREGALGQCAIAPAATSRVLGDVDVPVRSWAIDVGSNAILDVVPIPECFLLASSCCTGLVPPISTSSGSSFPLAVIGAAVGAAVRRAVLVLPVALDVGAVG